MEKTGSSTLRGTDASLIAGDAFNSGLIVTINHQHNQWDVTDYFTHFLLGDNNLHISWINFPLIFIIVWFTHSFLCVTAWVFIPFAMFS